MLSALGLLLLLSCHDTVNCGGRNHTAELLKPIALAAPDGSCSTQFVVNDVLYYDYIVITPFTDHGDLDDLSLTITNYNSCTPLSPVDRKDLAILRNCSSEVLGPSRVYPLLCSSPELGNPAVYYYSTMMRHELYELNCTTLIYTPSGHDCDVGEIWDLMGVRVYASWTRKDVGCGACVNSGGGCRNNPITGGSCRYRFHLADFKGQHKSKPMKKIMLGGFAIIGLVFLLFIFRFFYRRPNISILYPRKTSWKDNYMEAYLEKFEKLVPTRYSYSDVEDITSCFSHKLGQGGCGSVYKGKLQDGRPVAVKVLSDSRGSVKDFFNEVISIGCTYHVNIVTLLGFCSEGPKRVLIYEFMSNGSLEKFIYDEKQEDRSTLDGATLLQIAIGVARGLEYLHHGCNIGILHFDIKPHNILLDHDFCPKIADFGLAKLCRLEEGIIKMLGARGTVGYIAPEVVSRSYGEVSSKSDVYSYGMMLLEMVGGRKNCSVQEVHTSEIYLPHWICKDLDLDGNLKSFRAMAKVEAEIARRMVLVGLWCIQTKPSDRPSMTKVLDILEGRITELQMPPMPVLYCSPRSTVHTLSSESDEIGSVATS